LDGPKAQADGQEDEATATAIRLLNAAPAFGPMSHRGYQGSVSQRLTDAEKPQGGPAEANRTFGGQEAGSRKAEGGKESEPADAHGRKPEAARQKAESRVLRRSRSTDDRSL
jgi:hypothetical protein